MDHYELTITQYEWLNSATKEEFKRFLIHGPVQALACPGIETMNFTGLLRGIKVTKPVRSMALAMKEADQIRNEYIKAVGMIPLDEDTMGIADTPEQKAAV